MSVRQIECQTLRIVYSLIKAVEVDVVIAAALHLCELKCLLFSSHVVDINYLSS